MNHRPVRAKVVTPPSGTVSEIDGEIGSGVRSPDASNIEMPSHVVDPIEQYKHESGRKSSHSRIFPKLGLPCSGHEAYDYYYNGLSFLPAESLNANHLAHTAIESASPSIWYERTSTHILAMLVFMMIAIAIVEAYEKIATCFARAGRTDVNKRRENKAETSLQKYLERLRGWKPEDAGHRSDDLIASEKYLMPSHQCPLLESTEDVEDTIIEESDFWGL